jgi:mono/diheme cytochrome c family protein
MAATDKTYRPQKTLDIVFAVSCVFMLVSIFWMFEQDYNREFKKIQREFRDVDEAMTLRTMLEKLPDVNLVKETAKRVDDARKTVDDIKSKNSRDLRVLLTAKAKQEARYQEIKASYDSIRSLFEQAVDKRDEAADPAALRAATGDVEKRKKEVETLESQLIAAQKALDATNEELKVKQAPQREAEAKLKEAEAELKRVSGEFDRFAKATALKRWKISDTIRNLPVIDGFAAPTRIQQYTLTEYPIDYSFKYVTRYDRCGTCHLGITLPAMDRPILEHLVADRTSDDLQQKLNETLALYQERAKNDRALGLSPKDTLGFDPGDLPTKVQEVKLSASQISEYCAHPRLDLFVGENSPHPAEKFGCTSCHSGQGSATDFVHAAHSPNTADQRRYWIENKDWDGSENWDFPMLPNRFIEATCLKCHHQVTDLVRFGNRVEAPKLMRGFNLLRENGCFGCHEIAGLKDGREIGPDLRLEMSPPLEAYSPAERARLLADTENPPGTMRKVGPSLYRLSEKTDEHWVRRWIESPRGFRPTTKMPHFYGLSNNSPEVLPTDQKEFPDAEIYSIAAYLFQESNAYLDNSDRFRKALKVQIQNLEEMRKSGLISDNQSKQLEELTHRLGKEAEPLTKIRSVESGKAEDLPPAPKDQKAKDDQLAHGRKLFTERGCLACHVNQNAPVHGEATFGPDLSRIAAKIVPQRGTNPDKARLFLTQWVYDPNWHSPRTFMPVSQLTVQEANDVAAWLLAQPAEGWDAAKDLPVPSSQTLAELAKVYLLKAPGMTRAEIEEILAPGENNVRRGITDLAGLADDADERELAAPLDDQKLKWYIGRKAISRLGCFGCHDIPGFAASKPVGTQLNDWGRKDPQRLAFEDVVAFVKEHTHPVESLIQANGHGAADQNGKPPYDEYFLVQLEHHQRDGFLNQKLMEPRSYDFNRERTWDDRLRMPQFKFARSHRKPLEGETPEQQEVREESEAREAVMTFVLGLVAEPVPAKFLYDPAPDKLAEIKGRLILAKYNCIGCHQVRSGVYELAKNPALTEKLEDKFKQTIESQSFKGDFHTREFLESNAWTGLASPLPDRLLLYGIPAPLPPDPEPDQMFVRLTQALQFKDSAKQPRDIPAGEVLDISLKDTFAHTKPSEPFGGEFPNLIVRSKYLSQVDPQKFQTSANGESPDARAALPPPLLREGEKTQPAWLYQFLRHPFAIRPLTVLRMPRFNMSDEEAMNLVNYFSAVDQMTNPGIGLSYPYPPPVAQKQESFWQDRTRAYVALLKEKNLLEQRQKVLQPIWDSLIAQDKKLTQKDLVAAFENSEAYGFDAYRLLASNDRCLNCHAVGPLPPKQPIGPPLDLSADRLRSEWLLRWIASPQRLLIYPDGQHPMPQNFKSDAPPWPEFAGSMLDQVTAVRDALIDYPRLSTVPINRAFRPAEGGK